MPHPVLSRESDHHRSLGAPFVKKDAMGSSQSTEPIGDSFNSEDRDDAYDARGGAYEDNDDG